MKYVVRNIPLKRNKTSALMEHQLLVGDFNENNEITITDYIMILQKRYANYNETNKIYDLNHDKKIDDLDADIVARNCPTLEEAEDFEWETQQMKY